MGNRKANYRRTVLRLPDLDHSESPGHSTVWPHPGHAASTSTQSSSSPRGIVRNPAWLSIALWWFVTAFIWKREDWPPTPSTSSMPLCAGWHTKRPMRGC